MGGQFTMPKFNDVTGQRFGKLTVISLYSRASRNPWRQTKWLCKCDCGNEIVVQQGNLHTGNTKGCGCLRVENNGAFIPNKNRLYNSWRAMKYRCNSKSSNRYYTYGGRGIKVCDEWNKSFAAFREWSLANGYREDLTIDRIDVDGNYEPSNCRWIPPNEQAKNKRRNKNYGNNKN